MIKIELIKFEAQDVITASGVCTHQNVQYDAKGSFWIKYCGDCNTELDHGVISESNNPFKPRPW